MHMWERTGFCLRKIMLRFTEQRGQYLPDTMSRHMFKMVIIMIFLILIIPVIQGKAYAVSAFYMQRPQLAFNLSFEYDKDIRIAQEKSQSSAGRLREGFDIRTNGWVYHPALIVYSLSYSPEWEQSRSSSKLDTNSTFNGYSTDVTFLQFKPYTLHLYAKRTSSRIRSDFAETSRLDSDLYGAILSLKYKALPTVLGYSHVESRQTGFFETDTDEDSYNLTMFHRRQRTAFSLTAFYTDLKRDISGQILDNEIKHIDLKNSIVILENNDLTLDSGVAYEESLSTNVDTEQYYVRETLIWHYNTDLVTKYSFYYESVDSFDKKLQASVPRKTISHNFNLNHGLYENLTTHINADFDKFEIGKNRDQQYGGGISLDYRRRIPWGRLGLNTGQAYRIVEVQESDDITRIFDEVYNIDDTASTFLAKSDVDINSLSITDTSGNLLLEDIHYTLVETGGFIGIRCKPALPGCSTGIDVLVDYRYRSRFPFDYANRSQTYGIKLNFWSVLDLHYSYSTYEQKFLRGIRPDELSKDIIHNAGAELEWRKTQTTVEFEDVESRTGLSLRRIRLMESVSFKTEGEWYINMAAGYTVSDFENNDETSKVSNIIVSAEKLVFDSGILRTEAFMRNVRSDVEDRDDIGFSAFLQWVYNIYDVDLTYMFNNEKNSVLDRTIRKHYILLKLRRNLF